MESEGELKKYRETFRDKISSMSFEELQKLKAKIGLKEFEREIFGEGTKKRNLNDDFKRLNKNRPREMSSKRKPVENVNSTKNFEVRKHQNQPSTRDPRFDPLCGTFDRSEFNKNYRFIDEIKEKEKSALEKELRSCQDPERKKIIVRLLQRIKNQLKTKQTDQNQTKSKGSKDSKIKTLIGQYEELKKNNKLQKHIERRSKKLSKKTKLMDQ